MKKIYLLICGLLAFAGSGFSQNLPSYVTANGLVGWWPFNGNANDESGNNNNGTVNGATLTTDRFGNSNTAYYFNGNQTIDLGNKPEFNFSGPFTISAWAKKNTTSNQWHILGKRNGSFEFQYQLSSNDLPWGLAFGGQGSVNSFLGTGILIPNLTWEHFVGSFDGTNWKIYKNDSLVGTMVGGLTATVTANLLFGNSGNAQGYVGTIDDIAIYNRALTEQEITALYQGANTTTNCPTFPASLAQGLVGYWPFCGNALDESGNNNHGTVNGATLTTDRFGNAGSAYKFDQINQNSITGNLSNFTPSAFSISIWGKHKTGQTGNSPINGNQPFEWLLGLGTPTAIAPTNEAFALGVYNNTSTISTGSWGNLFTTGASIDTTWKNFVVTYENNLMKVFQAGILVSSNPVTFNFSSYPYCFGRQLMGINEFWNGSLDDIAIWNRALSQSEITQLYNQGICQTSITVTDTLLIHTGITSYNPVAYGNTLKVWPNPGNQDITLDAGNLSSMQGWKYKVANTLGQTVVNETAISQQQTMIDLTNWGGNGIYYLHLINPQGHAIEIKKIVLAP